MKKFAPLNSKLVPIAIKDVDTDMIIPAQFLTSISSDGYGKNLFRRLRDNDPNFPLDQERYKGASILVSESNFGCGSSREHAVWALTGAGIHVVIAKSFADIFYNNSAKTGLLLVILPEPVVDRLLRESQADNLELTVNLEEQTVTHPSGEAFHFDYDPFRKHCILNGLDDIDYILSHKQDIAGFRARQEESGLTTISTRAN